MAHRRRQQRAKTTRALLRAACCLTLCITFAGCYGVAASWRLRLSP